MMFHPRAIWVAAMLVAWLAAPGIANAQSNSGWTLAPYRVRVLLAVDTSSVPSAELADRTGVHLTDRVDSAIGAEWDLVVAEADYAESILYSESVLAGQTPPQHEDATLEKLDKTFVVVVREDVLGLRMGVAEYDHNLLRWGEPAVRQPALADEVPELVFRLICDRFAPLAEFRVSQQVGGSVELIFRGSELPLREGAPEWVREGDLFLPLLRRINREGQVDPEGVRPVPWTYLQVTQLGEDPTAEFISHTRRPLPSRRRGRVDYLAIRLPRQKAPMVLRAHARDKPDKPLVGYQVYLQDGEDAPRTLAGATGPDGRLTLQPGESRVLMAYIKSGSQLVAKLPIVPGAEDLVQVPLLDETPRLNAEAKLGILREDLIDLVAQRQILISRIEAAIEAEDYEQAGKLVSELERLPARALFDRRLRLLEQSSTSDMPLVQKRIDRIFSDTRTVLATFLNPRDVQQIKTRLANARR